MSKPPQKNSLGQICKKKAKRERCAMAQWVLGLLS